MSHLLLFLDLAHALIPKAIQPNQEEAQDQQEQVLCNCFSYVSTRASVNWSTLDLSMIRIASPLIVQHTYTQDQENINISTT